MKVTTTYNGTEILLEGNDVNELAGFVNALVEQKKEQIKVEDRNDRIEKAIELNKDQFELWEYLVDNDCEGGIPIAAIARHFQIKDSTIGQRLCSLVRMGYAFRTGRGRYRWMEKVS